MLVDEYNEEEEYYLDEYFKSLIAKENYRVEREKSYE